MTRVDKKGMLIITLTSELLLKNKDCLKRTIAWCLRSLGRNAMHTVFLGLNEMSLGQKN